jgi:hypothetical protein
MIGPQLRIDGVNEMDPPLLRVASKGIVKLIGGRYNPFHCVGI